MSAVCSRATRQAYAGLVDHDYVERVIAHWYGHDRLLAEFAPSPGWFGFTVAEIEEAVAGVAGTGRGPEVGTCELYTLYVDPAHQRRGAGRTLVAHAVEQAREAGASRVQVAVMPGNVGAIAFYEACGFEYAGERPIYAPHGAEGGPGVALVFERGIQKFEI